MLKKAILCFAVALAYQGAAHARPGGGSSDLEILQSYAEDYVRDPFVAKTPSFGVKVGETFYTVAVEMETDDGAPDVSVSRGAPDEPTFYFTIENSDYLRKLDRGEFNALTLMAKAFSSDVTPMDVEFMDGFQPDEALGENLIPLIFHFWTRGKPETVPFGSDRTRFTHGANMGVLYYEPGLRSGWFDIRPGQHVNEDERSRTNPFPSMFIMIDGEVNAIIDGKEVLFTEGNMMFVPAGVSHQFINDGDASAFGFLFMFGDGA